MPSEDDVTRLAEALYRMLLEDQDAYVSDGTDAGRRLLQSSKRISRPLISLCARAFDPIDERYLLSGREGSKLCQ